MESNAQFGSGMFDIFRGTCFGDPDCVCAFKVMRRQSFGERTREVFNRQLELWKSIQTKATDAKRKGEKVYILPLIGAVFRDAGPKPFM